MPATRSKASATRTSARRRARKVARGEEAPEPVAATAVAQPARPPNLLTRLFPPAPPLAGKGDPLAGFTYTGRFRGLVSGAWLLLKHPLPWGLAGAGWAVLQFALAIASGLGGGQNLVAFGITLGQYALLIGAGWFGWQRPWLFGVAAAVLGVALNATIAGLDIARNGGDLSNVVAIFGGVSAYLVLYGLVGAFAGFYGGYLRRRMAKPAPAGNKGKRR
jgi:hypothetical protein